MNKRFFLLLCTLSAAASNLSMNASAQNSPKGKKSYSEATKGQSLAVTTPDSDSSDWQQEPQSPTWDNDASSATHRKRLSVQSPKSDTPHLTIEVIENGIMPDESKESSETKQIQEATSVLATGTSASKKAISSGRLPFSWRMANEANNITYAFETHPEDPQSKAYRNSHTGHRQMGKQAIINGAALVEQSTKYPESITPGNNDLNMVSTILQGCTKYEIGLTQDEHRDLWTASKTVKDQGLQYIDKHSLAEAEEHTEKLANFIGERSKLTATLTENQRKANKLSKKVGANPENQSDDEDWQWGPRENFNRSTIRKSVSRPIPGSNLLLTVSYSLEENPEVLQKEQTV